MTHALIILALAGQLHAIPTPASSALNTSSFPDSAPSPSACDDIHGCRTLWGIIYSCIITIFACTYLSFHPNVPNPSLTEWRIRVTRVCAVFFGFLIPEAVVAKAAAQWWGVWNDDTPFQNWTRTHSFFMAMGGFYEGRYSLDSWHRLTYEPYPEILKLVASTADSKEDEPSPEPTTPPTSRDRPSKFRILVTKSEILDKSKGDALGKLFTVLQTTWFIVQYLERWAARQPRTQLEVMTLAYAAVNILVYALWWDKPLNIQEPIYVHGRASAPTVDRTEGLDGLRSILNDALDSILPDDNGMTLITVFPVVGILFGGIHCFAWRFPFPNRQERVLWRVCAVYCTASPFLVPLIVLIFGAPHDDLPNWCNAVLEAIQFPFKKIKDLFGWLGNFHPWIKWVAGELLPGLSAGLPMVLYVACRIILVVLTFTNLRAPPAGVYESTSWTSFLPHFG